MKIGIIVAMDKEFVQLTSLLTESREEEKLGKKFVLGTIGQNEIIMQQCGIGKVNSAIGAVEMIHAYEPQLIISTGVAGGADIEMSPLDVVVGTNYVYHDFYCGSDVAYGQVPGLPTYFETQQQLIDKALSINTDTRIYPGLIVSGDWFVDTQEKMRTILSHFPQAKGVDMESCSIAHTCHLYNIPFISFRIISDVPLKDHQASQYFDFWERMANGSFEVTRKFLEKIEDNKILLSK